MNNKPTFGTLFSGGGIADCGFVADGQSHGYSVRA